ncbi:MAG: PQQ-like beta-propeller repeat protein [Phycisphaerae bacterium]|jgi:outer membrane protein assembly factor BamB
MYHDHRVRQRRVLVGVGLTAILSALAARGATPTSGWPQWGGINRDFRVQATGLADHWPVGGPKRLWSRPLGEGYAAIVSDGTTLFTMYRKGDNETVVALRGETGTTAWEHVYSAPTYDKQTADFGEGPQATPLLFGDKLLTVGFTGILHCLDAKTGKPLWSHDLVKQFDGKIQYYGYANSPIAHDGSIIVLVGGKDHGVIAFDPDDGTPVWKSRPYDISYAAPVLINVDGQDQLVFFSTKEVIGLDPTNGTHLWSHKVINFCRTNCTQAVWGKDNLLWAATKGVGGTRVVRLSQKAGKTSVEEVWLNRKVKLYHWNAIRVGDYVYTSIGDSSKFLTAVDVRTGKVQRRLRGYGATNGIYADGKLILLDDDGTLILGNVDEGKIEINATAQILDSLTWTVPTLIDTTLFVRDRTNVMAFDLGEPTAKKVAHGS